jgi:fatty acid synthase
LGPVGGIFNLAVVLKDGILENQNEATFRESFGPKALATKHLDEISRKMCPELEQFVVFSSVSCGRGNAGQTNYGMANSIMERIVERRAKDGLPGKAIQWGAIGEVGLIANMQESNVELEIGGTLQQRISSCLQVMDALLATNEPIVSSIVVAEKRYDNKGSKNILETIMRVMGIRDVKSISMDSTLSELGMDSLMGVEIHQLLERDFDCVLTTEEMRSITLSELQKKVRASAESDISQGSQNDHRKEQSYMELILNDFENSINNIDVIVPLNDNSKDKSTKVLIVPGIEGKTGSTWFKLANKLCYPTYALQLIKTSHLKGFEEVYDAIIEVELTQFNFKI